MIYRYFLPSDYSPYQKHASLVVTHWTGPREHRSKQAETEPAQAN